MGTLVTELGVIKNYLNYAITVIDVVINLLGKKTIAIDADTQKQIDALQDNKYR